MSETQMKHLLIITTLFAISGWAGIIYLLTMIAAAR